MFKKTALKAAFKFWQKGNFTVVFWDGEEAQYGEGTPAFKIVFKKEPEITGIKQDLILTLGEAYMHGVIDFEGSMDAIISTMFRNSSENAAKDFHFAALLKDFKEEDGQTERENIHRHYDLGNDFFSLWLDKTMSYSCAYFAQDGDDLAQAQQQKIDHSLKKLNLKAGEHLLDIGCGWGWLAIRAAQLYRVHATGITLSREQYEGANKRIRELGLQELVDIRLANYMDMDEKQEQFDKIVSIGMFEHVGKKYLPLYLAKVNHLLKEQGLFLLHSIMGEREAPTNSWMRTYIFPGGYVPTLRETVQLFPDFSFKLLHLESLRRHYAKTLDLWYENFSKCQEPIGKKYGEEFVRMWGLYLQGCAAAFRTGNIDVYQCLLSKGTNNELPMTAAYIYQK
jgi:cyclopropane-fatty-acyl-phospholipid synthase